MNITYIHNCRMPTEKAHGYQIAKMCEAFADNSVSVELIVPARNNHIKDDIFSYYHTKNNFTIRYIKFVDFLSWSWLNQKISFTLNILEFLWLSLFLKIDKQNIIYTRSPEIAWLFGVRGYKTFFECHQLPEEKSWLFSFFIKKINTIVTISNGLKQDLADDYAYPADKILTSPDGVDLETFDIKITKQEARAQLDLPIDIKIVLYTGHLFAWKGVDTLAEASKDLSEEIRIYALGGDEKEINEFNSRNPGHRVINIPSVPRESVAIWLKAADLLVLPNSAKEKISEKYTSPLKLFEYMASGTPILASDLPSIREILDDKGSIFFTPDNALSLLDEINDLLLQNDNLNQMNTNNKQIINNYTWHNRAVHITHFMG